jgi:Zn-dependent M28 family amino/carboxypeptidase
MAMALCLPAGLSLLAVSCLEVSPPPAPQPLPHSLVDGREALAEVERFITISPRDAGTAGAEAAAAYLAKELRSANIQVETDTFTNSTPGGKTVFRNVVATLPAKKKGDDNCPIIVLVSHYDTKSGIGDGFTGANDSGSSTGLLLALAKALKRYGGAMSDIQFAFVDGEECMERYSPRDGLHGSQRLAARLRSSSRAADVKAVIVVDMIGDADLSITIPRNSTRNLISVAFQAGENTGHRKSFSLARSAILDDHVPFLQKQFPAIDLIDFQYGSRPRMNDYWHTMEDSIDKLDARSLEAVGQVVIEMINILSL